jgi:hypothetical protein
VKDGPPRFVWKNNYRKTLKNSLPTCQVLSEMSNMEKIQEINTLRIYSKVLKNRISIKLPKSFDAREVELIIIPRTIKSLQARKTKLEEWKGDFLDISQWDVAENDIKMKS